MVNVLLVLKYEEEFECVVVVMFEDFDVRRKWVISYNKRLYLKL